MTFINWKKTLVIVKTATFKLKNEIFQDILVSFKKTNIDQLGSVLLIFFMNPTLQQFMPVGELLQEKITDSHYWIF